MDDIKDADIMFTPKWNDDGLVVECRRNLSYGQVAGSAYVYSRQEIEGAAMAGIDLDHRKRDMALRALRALK